MQAFNLDSSFNKTNEVQSASKVAPEKEKSNDKIYNTPKPKTINNNNNPALLDFLNHDKTGTVRKFYDTYMHDKNKASKSRVLFPSQTEKQTSPLCTKGN